MAFIMLCIVLNAHHAKEYFNTESYAVSPQGGLILFNGFDYYQSAPGTYHWEYTPTLIYGLTNRLMLGFHSHYYQNNNLSKPIFEAGAFALQYQLTKPDEQFLDIALITEYEFPYKKSVEQLDGTHLWINTLVLSKELPGDINTTANIKYEQELNESKANQFQFNLAGKGHPIPKFDWLEGGVELWGTTGSNPELYTTAGFFAQVSPKILIKSGITIGLNTNSDNVGGHAILVYTIR